MTAKTLVRERASESGSIREITARNVAKVTKFREGGEEELEREVRKLETVAKGGEGEVERGLEGWETVEGVRERRQEGNKRRKGEEWWREESRGRRDPNSGRRYPR